MKFPLRLIAVLGIINAIHSIQVDAQTLHLGNPYSPTGATYQIYAYQDMTPGATSLTGTQTGASVNQDFEFTPGIGVSRTGKDAKGNPISIDFGIGLYDAVPGSLSTGLDVHYNTLVYANSVTITLADFDLGSAAKDFNSAKVAATALIQTSKGIYSATSADVFKYMTYAGLTNREDTWNLNVGGLLASKGAPVDAFVSDVYLAASLKNIAGVATSSPSDPYFITAVSSGVTIPEPGSFALLASSCAVILGVRHRKRN